jgi:small neutral amino acid transporter SnatA (MarC family)
MIFTGSVILISVAVIFICLLIDLLMQWKYGMKLLKLFSGLLFIFSILYIFGQAGSMDLNQISIPQFIIRSGIGLVILAADTVLINYIQWKEENG